MPTRSRSSLVVGLCTFVGFFGGIHAAESPLPARLKPLIAEHKGKVAMAVKHLTTGEEFAHDSDAVMPTASLIKLPVMAAAYRLADDGKLDLARMLTLRDEDKVQGSGILTSHFTAGTQITVRDAIRLMIAFSDNTATNLVVDQIGLKTTAETMEQLGFPNTKLHAKVFRGETSIFPERSKQFGLGSTTPREMVRLLALLHENKLASESSCAAMMKHLHACDDRNKLPRDLPTGTKIAHKTGAVNAVRTDAGIIFSASGPIAICVMTAENDDKSWTPANAGEVLCGKIGRAVFDHFNPPGLAKPGETPTNLAIGSMGPLVEALQRTLNARLNPSPELGVDGDFGGATREAVVRFQRDRKLPATGEVTPPTWQELGPLLVEAVPAPDPSTINGEQLVREPADGWRAPPVVSCKAWAIADAKTGVLLWGKHERQPLDFASTTKVMTALIVLTMAEKDPRVLDEIVTFSQRADDTVGSSAELRVGEQVSVRELLFGLMLPSGNDASTAFAEHFGQRLAMTSDTEPYAAFIAKMNRTAQELGMSQTHYENPHGLTHPRHRSTAADLLILAHAARSLPSFREYVNTRQRGCTVRHATAGYTRNVLWKNTNKLLGIDGYDGVKTGTTDAAGACLVSSGRNGDDELLVVVLGSATSDARYLDSRNLFRWAWNERR